MLNDGRIKGGLLELPDQRLFVSSNTEIQLVKQHHEKTRLGKPALESLLSHF